MVRLNPLDVVKRLQALFRLDVDRHLYRTLVILFGDDEEAKRDFIIDTLVLLGALLGINVNDRFEVGTAFRLAFDRDGGSFLGCIRLGVGIVKTDVCTGSDWRCDLSLPSKIAAMVHLGGSSAGFSSAGVEEIGRIDGLVLIEVAWMDLDADVKLVRLAIGGDQNSQTQNFHSLPQGRKSHDQFGFQRYSGQADIIECQRLGIRIQNGLLGGANVFSCRVPIVSFDEDDIGDFLLDRLESLGDPMKMKEGFLGGGSRCSAPLLSGETFSEWSGLCISIRASTMVRAETIKVQSNHLL